MTRFRYWLADLISGGELTNLRISLSIVLGCACKSAGKRNLLNMALRRIVAEVKPTSNATVKRIGRIAVEALK